MHHNTYPSRTRPETAFGTKIALAAAALVLVAGCDGMVSNPIKKPAPKTYGPAPPTSCSTHAHLTDGNTVHVTAVADNGKPLHDITYYLGKRNAHDGSLVDFLPPHKVAGNDGTNFTNVSPGTWAAVAEFNQEACRQSGAIIIRSG